MNRLPFYSPDLDRGMVEASIAGDELVNILESDEVHDLIRSGNLTLAMIRPNIGPKANLQSLSDLDAADAVEEQIVGLAVATKFSIFFDERAVEEFYAEVAPAVSLATPIKDLSFSDRWQEYKHTMTSGPPTVLLLLDNDGQAVERWRAHLGHWDIETTRDPATIRGRMGVDNANNLVHGSDSSESVFREINIISSLVQRTTK